MGTASAFDLAVDDFPQRVLSNAAVRARFAPREIFLPLPVVESIQLFSATRDVASSHRRSERDFRHNWRAMGSGSMLTAAHQEASSP